MALALRHGLARHLAASVALLATACAPEPDRAVAPETAIEMGTRSEYVHPGAPHAARIAGPGLAVDREETAWLAWIRSVDGERSVKLARRVGDGFEVARVDPEGFAPSSAHQAPGLAAGPDGRVHLTWSVAREDAGDSPFASDLVVRSADAAGSVEIETPRRLNEDRPGSRGFEGIAVRADGALVAAWLEGGRTSRSRVAVVEPGGDGLVTTLDEQACPCCRFALASAADGRVGLLWRDELPGKVRDMVFAVAGPDGLSSPRSVRRDGWSLAACTHRGGALAFAPDGRALAVWYTEGDDSRPRLLAAWGGEEGFDEALVVHEGEGSFPDRVALAIDPVGLGVVLWERRTPVRSEIAARTVRGRSLGPVRVLSQGVKASEPQIVARPSGGFLASWNEEVFPTLRTVVTTLDPAPDRG
jgi:hypothetical protein